MRISQKRRTTIQPEGKQATWNESFKLPVHIAETQKLELVLYDHDNIGSDDELGRSAAVTLTCIELNPCLCQSQSGDRYISPCGTSSLAAHA